MPVALSVDRIQGLSGSLAVKIPVDCATTAAITLEGLQTIDGIDLADGDRVLVKDQIDQTTNGIYTVTTSSWSRGLDFNKANDVLQGTLIHVYRGVANPGLWAVTSSAPVIGTTALTFQKFATGVAGSGGLPDLPSASLDDGSGWVLYTNGITSTWVQASTITDTTTNTFAVYNFTASGGETTVTLPFSYTVGGKNLIVMLQGLINYPTYDYTEDSSTQITFLTPLKADEKVRIIGNIVSAAYVPTDATLAALYALTPAANKFPYFTSGTAAALESISSFVRGIMNSADGPAFLTAIGAASTGSYSQVGAGQTWQDKASSRAINTSYQNDSGKEIQVIINMSNAASSTFQVSTNSSTWVAIDWQSNEPDGSYQAIIPKDYYYKVVTSGGAIHYWSELR